MDSDARNLNSQWGTGPWGTRRDPTYFTVFGSPVLTEFHQNIKCKIHSLCRTFPLFLLFSYLLRGGLWLEKLKCGSIKVKVLQISINQHSNIWDFSFPGFIVKPFLNQDVQILTPSSASCTHKEVM